MPHHFAFIDSQNLNLAIQDQGWKLDFTRFRRYLSDKYDTEKVFLFIGYVPGNEALYTSLQKAGYIVIFKPTLEFKREGERVTKGNVDAELVLHAMIEFPHYDKAIIVSGDGDFHCLLEYLEKRGKLLHVLIPNPAKYSALLRKFHKYFASISALRKKLSYNPAQPQKHEDGATSEKKTPARRAAAKPLPQIRAPRRRRRSQKQGRHHRPGNKPMVNPSGRGRRAQ